MTLFMKEVELRPQAIIATYLDYNGNVDEFSTDLGAMVAKFELETYFKHLTDAELEVEGKVFRNLYLFYKININQMGNINTYLEQHYPNSFKVVFWSFFPNLDLFEITKPLCCLPTLKSIEFLPPRQLQSMSAELIDFQQRQIEAILERQESVILIDFEFFNESGSAPSEFAALDLRTMQVEHCVIQLGEDEMIEFDNGMDGFEGITIEQFEQRLRKYAEKNLFARGGANDAKCLSTLLGSETRVYEIDILRSIVRDVRKGPQPFDNCGMHSVACTQEVHCALQDVMRFAYLHEYLEIQQ